ncbi:MAG: hypothetical protein FWD87_11165 [Spirochaetaceae bacterium]|nr:hypothetical protein [Spirochaetaceae bacterium]
MAHNEAYAHELLGKIYTALNNYTNHSVSEYIEKCFMIQASQKKDGIKVFYRGVNQVYSGGTPHKPSIYYFEKRIQNEDRIYREALSLFPELLEQKQPA